VTAATAAATAATTATVAADAVALRVSSWNVQEHVRDGLSIYVALLPGVAARGGSGAGPRLVAAMMTPTVLARQRDDVLAFISAELRSGSDAVCLQEVTVALLAELRAAAAPRRWAVHCCGAEAAAAALPEGACAALTVVVTAAARGARPAPDVTVEVQQKTKVNRRAFAAVQLPRRGGGGGGGGGGGAGCDGGGGGGGGGDAFVVSCHVRHPRDGDAPGGAQPSNAENIDGAEAAIVQAPHMPSCHTQPPAAHAVAATKAAEPLTPLPPPPTTPTTTAAATATTKKLTQP